MLKKRMDKIEERYCADDNSTTEEAKNINNGTKGEVGRWGGGGGWCIIKDPIEALTGWAEKAPGWAACFLLVAALDTGTICVKSHGDIITWHGETYHPKT